jgi:integrase
MEPAVAGQPPAIVREWVTDYLRAFRQERHDRQVGVPTTAAPLSRTLGQLLEAYTEHRRDVLRVALATLNNDRGAVRMLMGWFGEDRPVETIHTDELQKRFDDRLRAGAACSTCRTQRANLCSFFTWAGVANNPAAGVQLKGERSKKKYGWSEEQIAEARAAADRIDERQEYSISARYLFELALGTGLREGELFAVEGRHFNEARHTYRVMQQASRYHGGLAPTKGRDTRTTIVLPDYWPFHPTIQRGFLLADRRGGLILQAKERNLIKVVMSEAGIKAEGEGTHMTRHTFARLYLEEYGGDLRDLQKFLGHKSIKTTETYYGHYSVDVAVERANQKMYGAPEGKPVIRISR